QSQVGGISAAAAKVKGVEWPPAHQKVTVTRSTATPRSDSPAGPAPILLPRTALPRAMVRSLLCRGRLQTELVESRRCEDITPFAAAAIRGNRSSNDAPAPPSFAALP